MIEAALSLGRRDIVHVVIKDLLEGSDKDEKNNIK